MLNNIQKIFLLFPIIQKNNSGFLEIRGIPYCCIGMEYGLSNNSVDIRLQTGIFAAEIVIKSLTGNMLLTAQICNLNGFIRLLQKIVK